MNKEDLKGLEGMEFIYIFEDGDTIKSYVKKVDLEVGITCMSLETETASGWRPVEDVEEDGTFCVTAFNFKDGHHSIEEALECLSSIPSGCYIGQDSFFGTFGGCAF